MIRNFHYEATEIFKFTIKELDKRHKHLMKLRGSEFRYYLDESIIDITFNMTEKFDVSEHSSRYILHTLSNQFYDGFDPDIAVNCIMDHISQSLLV